MLLGSVPSGELANFAILQNVYVMFLVFDEYPFLANNVWRVKAEILFSYIFCTICLSSLTCQIILSNMIYHIFIHLYVTPKKSIIYFISSETFLQFI